MADVIALALATVHLQKSVICEAILIPGMQGTRTTSWRTCTRA